MDLVYTDRYEGHSSTKVNFIYGVGKKEHFTVAPFSNKSIVVGSFMSQNTVSMTFFTDLCLVNIFSVFPLHKLSSRLSFVVANLCLFHF